jgi:Galactose oxidase, central domain/Kelch motif
VNPRMLSVVLLLLVLSSSYTSKAGAEELGTFIPAGEMTKVRSAHTATLLTDGRVLVTGGSTSGVVLSAAEIYDPATGVFTTTGDLNAPRYGHTATLLSDGTVLVAGGIGTPWNALGSAELYDPSVGTFTPVGSMVTSQFKHTATLLPDGRVLVAGGQANFPPVAVAGAEIYDPSTGLFTSTGSYQAPNAMYGSIWGPLWPTATLLPGGTVFIAGNNPAELYDPLTGTFRLTATMTGAEYRYGMYWHTSTLLSNGKVLIAGGTDDNGAPFAHAELYDPSTETFTAAGTMALRPTVHTATLLPNGKVLIAGGNTWVKDGPWDRPAGSVSSAEYYDPITGNFVPTSSMSAARSSHTATLLTDGTVLITGGITYAPFQAHASTELFVPSTGFRD